MSFRKKKPIAPHVVAPPQVNNAHVFVKRQ